MFYPKNIRTDCMDIKTPYGWVVKNFSLLSWCCKNWFEYSKKKKIVVAQYKKANYGGGSF